MSLVFLDTETTGLELHHDIWEIAFAIGDGEIESHILPHSLKNADPVALELNGYWDRFPDGARAKDVGIDLELRQMLEGATIVGANPGFDAIRLQLRWQAQPWHHRMIDISSMAVAVFGFMQKTITGPDGNEMSISLPPGLIDVAVECRRFGEVPEPDHTAAGDVATLRACYRILEGLRPTNYPQRWVSGLLDPASQGRFFETSPVCTCPITDPIARSTAYTVARLGDEPHAVDCPRRGRRQATA